MRGKDERDRLQGCQHVYHVLWKRNWGILEGLRECGLLPWGGECKMNVNAMSWIEVYLRIVKETLKMGHYIKDLNVPERRRNSKFNILRQKSAWHIWRMLRASLVAQMVKNLLALQETWFDPWVGKIPWKRAWQPTPVFLAWRILIDRGAWYTIVHGVAKSWTQLNWLSMHACIYIYTTHETNVILC